MTKTKKGKITEHSKHEIRDPIGSNGQEQYHALKEAQNKKEVIGIRRAQKNDYFKERSENRGTKKT